MEKPSYQLVNKSIAWLCCCWGLQFRKVLLFCRSVAGALDQLNRLTRSPVWEGGGGHGLFRDCVCRCPSVLAGAWKGKKCAQGVTWWPGWDIEGFWQQNWWRKGQVIDEEHENKPERMKCLSISVGWVFQYKQLQNSCLSGLCQFLLSMTCGNQFCLW